MALQLSSTGLLQKTFPLVLGVPSHKLNSRYSVLTSGGGTSGISCPLRVNMKKSEQNYNGESLEFKRKINVPL